MNPTTAYTFRPCWLLIVAACLPLQAQAQSMGCLIEPDRVAEIGSPVVGVIEQMLVERGERVRQGQVIAVLRDDVERASLKVASSKAESTADIEAAISSAKFNRERLIRAEDLYRQNFIALQALDQARTEADMADQKLAQAKEQRRITQHERSLSVAQLSLRTIRSPIDGVIAERYLSAGERVDDKPIARVAKVNPLRVQLVVSTQMYGQLHLNDKVKIEPDLPGANPADAKVTMVDKVVDPASNTFRVQLELPNANMSLPAGLRCKAQLNSALPALAAVARPSAVNSAADALVDTAGDSYAENLVLAPVNLTPPPGAPATPAAPAKKAETKPNVTPPAASPLATLRAWLRWPGSPPQSN